MARGQKTCPKCNNTTGPRTAACPNCDHVWFQKKEAPIQTHGSGMRGKKRCPECEALVGVRTQKCTCGHEFSTTPAPAVQQKEETPAKKTVYKNGLAPIHVPAGSPPVKLANLTTEGVEEWAEQIFEHGLKNGKNYTPNAVCHFLRYFVDINSLEYKMLASVITGDAA